MANRTMEVIRRVFNWAIAEEIAQVKANPCLQMSPPGGRKTSRERALSESEVKAFWEKLHDAGITPSLKLALRFILVTAQRKGEVAGARWDEIDEDARVWTISAERSKNGLAHRVPLSDLAVRLLDNARELAGKSAFVFPSAIGTRPIAAGALNKAVHRTRERFGILAFTPHDLRRTAATQMASMGIPRLTIGKVLNHVEEGVTSVYDRYAYDAEKRQALEAWAQRLADLVGNSPIRGPAGEVEERSDRQTAPAAAR
jgi:integrase